MGGNARSMSPSRLSSLMTSAPRSPKMRPHIGPATTVVKSTTFRPRQGPPRGSCWWTISVNLARRTSVIPHLAPVLRGDPTAAACRLGKKRTSVSFTTAYADRLLSGNEHQPPGDFSVLERAQGLWHGVESHRSRDDRLDLP